MLHIAAVLDACVLYPGVLRDTLLRTLDEELYRGFWSDEIVAEVTRNLVSNGEMEQAKADQLGATLRHHFPEAFANGYEAFIPFLTCEIKDCHVLAAAIHAQALLIVTFNLKDFPATSLDSYGIEAQHPDVFLTQLYGLYRRPYGTGHTRTGW